MSHCDRTVSTLANCINWKSVSWPFIKVKTRVGFRTQCTKSHTAYVTGTQQHQAPTEEGVLFPPAQAGLRSALSLSLKNNPFYQLLIGLQTRLTERWPRPGICLGLFFWSKAAFLYVRLNWAVGRWRFKEKKFELWALWLSSDGIYSWDWVSERVSSLSDWWILGQVISQNWIGLGYNDKQTKKRHKYLLDL